MSRRLERTATVVDRWPGVTSLMRSLAVDAARFDSADVCWHLVTRSLGAFAPRVQLMWNGPVKCVDGIAMVCPF
jgi:hypothetical protein